MQAVDHVLTADAHVHRLYAEHAGLPVGVVTQCVQHATALGLAVWHDGTGTSWQEKSRLFYEQHEESLFDLLHHSTNRSDRRACYIKDHLWSWLSEAGSAVLDFGGGLGLTSSLLHELGKQVTYCEVDGPAARFAEWYFERNGQGDIEVVCTPSSVAVLPAHRGWDLVLAESVLECVPDPVATVERLAQAVRSGGLLHLSIDRHDPSSVCPMRRPVALADLLAHSPTLRAMDHVLDASDGRGIFRAR